MSSIVFNFFPLLFIENVYKLDTLLSLTDVLMGKYSDFIDLAFYWRENLIAFHVLDTQRFTCSNTFNYQIKPVS